jgi:hypothetical protein
VRILHALPGLRRPRVWFCRSGAVGLLCVGLLACGSDGKRGRGAVYGGLMNVESARLLPGDVIEAHFRYGEEVEAVAIGVRVRPRSHRLAVDILVRYRLGAGQRRKRGCVVGVLPARVRGMKTGNWIRLPTQPKARGCRRVAVQLPPYEIAGVTRSRPPERGL